MKILKGHYIYYINKDGEHIPARVLFVKEGYPRPYIISINGEAKNKTVSLNKIELQKIDDNTHCKENLIITEKHRLKESIESEKRCYVKLECWFCDEIIENSNVNSIHYEDEYYKDGWRIIESEKYATISLACPECVKKFNDGEKDL